MIDTGFAAEAQRHDEMEEARLVSIGLRSEIQLLAESAHGRDKHRVAELDEQNAEFERLRCEARDVENRLEVVLEAVSALETELNEERRLRRSEMSEATVLQTELHETVQRLSNTNEELDASERDCQHMAALLQDALQSRQVFIQQLRGGARPDFAQKINELSSGISGATRPAMELEYFTEEHTIQKELDAARAEAFQLRCVLASSANGRGSVARGRPPLPPHSATNGGESLPAGSCAYEATTIAQESADDDEVWKLEASAFGLRKEIEIWGVEVNQLRTQVEDSAMRLVAAKLRAQMLRAEAEAQSPADNDDGRLDVSGATAHPDEAAGNQSPPSGPRASGLLSVEAALAKAATAAADVAVQRSVVRALSPALSAGASDSLSATASLPSSPEAGQRSRLQSDSLRGQPRIGTAWPGSTVMRPTLSVHPSRPLSPPAVATSFGSGHAFQNGSRGPSWLSDGLYPT